MDLSGTWRAAVADEGLRRLATQSTFDDSGWEDLAVPGHWRSHPAFSGQDGPVLHRRTFEAAAPDDGRRAFLVFDGLFYQGDVWLDGSYVGDTEGYFFPHSFEVTEALRAQTEHTLAVEVTCSPQPDKRAKRNLTGVFQHWDCADPDWNPGGIWRPVRLEETGPVRISRLRVRCVEASAERAVLAVQAELNAGEATTAELRTTVGTETAGTEHRSEQRLSAGANTVRWRVTVDGPDLWWPWALGGQPLHEVAVEVTPLDRGPSHRRSVVTGLREVRMKRWVLSVNGERLFLKGSNQGPSRMALAEASVAELERDVVLAKEAGLDLLRLHAHVSRPEVYEAADRHGLLLWQDLPLQWGYARGVRAQATRQAVEAVNLLAHHPSLAVWCGHNEPVALQTEGASMATVGRQLARGTVLPTFNKTVLDGSIKRALDKADGSRPVVAHSGILPHPAWGTDTHVYFGWYHGHERDFPRMLARLPALAGFVSEFGAQAVPSGDVSFLAPERWPDLDWPRLGRHHSLQKAQFDRFVPPADYDSFDAWRDATQGYQATVIRHHVEALRRLKYRPTGGFCQFSLADGHPAVTWSVLGHDRVPKAGYGVLAAACAPVIVVADRPAATYAPGQAAALDVHVVSDLRHAVDGAEVRAVLSWPGGEHRWGWSGTIPADACVRVGTISFVAPDEPGSLCLRLTLDAPGTKAENDYSSKVVDPGSSRSS